MVSVNEAAGKQSQLSAALAQGVNVIDRDQAVTFTEYQKYTFSEDGYVFWVGSGATLKAAGSLHYGTDRSQAEDETIGVNNVIFTSEQEITQFNQIAPNTMWIATWSLPGGDGSIQIAFSRRGAYYEQANIWHYVGIAVYPALQSQIIQSAADLPAAPIVSNSLPIWLTQNSFAPVYASFLVPDNVTPPYVVVHIDPTQTTALQDFPNYTWPGTTPPGQTNASPFHDLPSDQLAMDRVKLTLYGFNNATAIQFYSSLMQYSLDTDAFGFMNMPAIRDEKRTQVEIAAIAQKKSIEIMASYYQSTADAIARNLILSASLIATPQAA